MRFRQHQDQARAATRRLLLLFLLTVLLTVLTVLAAGMIWNTVQLGRTMSRRVEESTRIAERVRDADLR